MPEMEYADDSEMQRRAATADEFYRVIGLVEGEDWPFFVSDEATIYDIWVGTDEGHVVERAKARYGVTLRSEDFRRPLWQLLDDLANGPDLESSE
jgi:hypothetical protein